MHAQTRLRSGRLNSGPSTHRARRRCTRSMALIEALEVRALLAASISGTIFEDLSGNGISAGDTSVSGRVVQLFRDNGDGVLNSGDALVGTATSGSDGTYSFRSLAAGTYFVK